MFLACMHARGRHAEDKFDQATLSSCAEAGPFGVKRIALLAEPGDLTCFPLRGML